MADVLLKLLEDLSDFLRYRRHLLQLACNLVLCLLSFLGHFMEANVAHLHHTFDVFLRGLFFFDCRINFLVKE